MGTDAGPQVSFDSGPPDTFPDAGPGMVGMDAGPPMMADAGAPDAGAPDAGPGGSGLALTPGFMMTLNGNTTGGTTWARPLATICPASGTSSVGTAVPYATHEVRNASSGTLSVHVGSTASWDGYLVIYAGTSVPSDPLMCIEGDDDSGTGSDPDLTFSLAAGASALIVVSGFDNMDFGSYVLSIDAS